MRYILSFILFLTASALQAQTPGGISGDSPWLVSHTTNAIWVAEGPSAAAPQAAPTVELSYFNSAAPTFAWPAPANFNPILIIGYSQRFTLPTESGFVDSIRIHIDTAIGGQIAVLLVPDTLATTGLGPLHLVDIFSGKDAYGGGAIPVASIRSHAWNTFVLPHVAVPKEFHVLVAGTIENQQVTGAVFVTGDNEPARPLTTENARSGFVGVIMANGAGYSSILDGQLQPAGEDSALYSDLLITVFADTTQTTGYVSRIPAAQSNWVVTPNPAASGSMAKLFNKAGRSNATVRLMDNLGREVSRLSDLRAEGASIQVPLPVVAAGAYWLEVIDSASVSILPILIQ